MKALLVISLVIFAACKTYNYAGDSRLMAYPPDFPEPIKDTTIKDTLEIRFGSGLDSGFTLEFQDTTITQALLDSLMNEHHKQDSVKHSYKII